MGDTVDSYTVHGRNSKYNEHGRNNIWQLILLKVVSSTGPSARRGRHTCRLHNAAVRSKNLGSSPGRGRDFSSWKRPHRLPLRSIQPFGTSVTGSKGAMSWDSHSQSCEFEWIRAALPPLPNTISWCGVELSPWATLHLPLTMATLIKLVPLHTIKRTGMWRHTYTWQWMVSYTPRPVYLRGTYEDRVAKKKSSISLALHFSCWLLELSCLPLPMPIAGMQGTWS